MEKKKVILTLGKSFPVKHSKAAQPTGFENKLKLGEKIHTIRYNTNNVWTDRYNGIKSGKKYLSVREWTGRPYNSVQRVLFRFDNIGLQHIEMVYNTDDAYPHIWVDGKEASIEEVAKNDGLAVSDFVEWFFGKNKENTFEGVIIHFTKFRY
jgi:hypothetical protein